MTGHRLASATTHSATGFTLMESMLILWVLSLSLAHHYASLQERQLHRAAQITAHGFVVLGDAAQHYRTKHGSWPGSLAVMARDLDVPGDASTLNGFGEHYHLEPGLDNDQLMIVTSANTRQEALIVCGKSPALSCAGERISQAVVSELKRRADDLLAALRTGSSSDLDANRQYVINIGSINSDQPNTIDLRVPGKKGHSQLGLYSLDAREIFADEVVGVMINDLDHHYAEHTRVPDHLKPFPDLAPKLRYQMFPQSRYPEKLEDLR